MRKYLLITGALLIGNTAIFSQFIRVEDRKRDSLLIDSLIKKIPVTKDTARINYLNKLGNTMIYAAYPMIPKAEWALPYVELAYKEATQSGYKKGVAYSLINFCQISSYYDIYNKRNNLDNSEIMNKYETQVNELLEIAIKINDPEILGNAYGYQASFWSKKYNKQKTLNSQINAIKWYKISGNETKECVTNLGITNTYLYNGEFENAFEYCKRSLELAKKLVQNRNGNEDNDVWLQASYINMATLYKAAGDYESAMNQIREGRQFHFTHNSSSTWGMEEQLVDIFLETGQYDSSMHYLGPIKRQTFSYQWIVLGYVYLKLNKSDSALKYYNLVIDSLEIRGTLPWAIDGLARSYSGKAKTLSLQKKYKEALSYAKKSLAMAQRSNKLDVVKNYELMSKLFHQLGKNDSAYLYLVKHNELKDSLLTRQFLFRLNNYKKEAEDAKRIGQINLLQKNNLIKEKELLQQILLKEKSEAQLALLDISNENKDQQLLIKDQSLKEQTLLKEKQLSQLSLLDNENKLKDQRLKQQTFIRNALLGGLLLLILLGVFVFRNLSLKRKNEKLAVKKGQAELQQKVSELEMQALRAQMNPHFIFNCLNSINRFIFKNETREASDYLTRFSRLIRMVLLHSQKKLVPLEDELEMLKLYLDMERLRFKNAFDYHITTTNAIENSSVFIPPLLLQPFCENAIWHGLMHKEGPGHLNIELNEDNGILNCIITDDGVGREKAEEFKSKSAEKEKSMGLKITKERLSLLNQGTTGGTFYEIEDVRNEQGDIAGTRVQLKIKYKETVEETV